MCVLAGYGLGQTSCDEGTDSDSEDELDSGTPQDQDASVGPTCEEIEWSPQDYYLAKGSTVAKWNQTGYVDSNGNGVIDPTEEVDATLDIVDMCNGPKESLVLLMATDD